MTIQAVYENGVFRPTEKVELPERCVVEVQVRPVGLDEHPRENLPKVYEILGRRHSSGYSDTAERHNEHQP